VVSNLRRRWRPLRRRLARALGLGRSSSGALRARLESAQRETAALLRRLHPQVAAAPAAAAGFLDHETKLYSQNGEDGLLLHIFSHIGVTDRRLVEFGIEDGRECLARALVTHFGWSALLMDCEAANVADAKRFFHDESGIDASRVKIVQSFVTAENIDATLAANGFEGDIDLLAIDIDGNDFWVWKAISAVRPRVVTIEYNASFGPGESVTVEYDPAFDRKAKHASGWYHGASLAALTDLGRRLGYALVGADSGGINAFFVRTELVSAALPEVTAEEAWRPHRGRSARATQAEQIALLRALPLVRNP
jgi:hypothetical protein